MKDLLKKLKIQKEKKIFYKKVMIIQKNKFRLIENKMMNSKLLIKNKKSKFKI